MLKRARQFCAEMVLAAAFALYLGAAWAIILALVAKSGAL
jgi:hypothetical protein